MNLIPIVISLGIAATTSIYYLQSQQEEPLKINYRAALREFEDAAEKLSQNPMGTLPMNATAMTNYCSNLNPVFEQQLPANSQWSITVRGLDCDIAKLSISTATDNFQNLINAAVASGIGIDGDIDTANSSLQWTQRLRRRSTEDLGVKSALKRANTSICFQCCDALSNCRTQGVWSYGNWVCDHTTRKRTRTAECSVDNEADCGAQESVYDNCGQDTPSN